MAHDAHSSLIYTKPAHLNCESRPNRSDPKLAVPFFVASPIFVRVGALTLTLLPAILSGVRLPLTLRGPRQRAAKDDQKSPCNPVVYTLLSQARRLFGRLWDCHGQLARDRAAHSVGRILLLDGCTKVQSRLMHRALHVGSGIVVSIQAYLISQCALENCTVRYLDRGRR